MTVKFTRSSMAKLLARFLASSFVLSAAFAQTSPVQANPGKKDSGKPAAENAAPAASSKIPVALASAENWHAVHGNYFKRNWGVDVFGVKVVASGEMLEFRYRVLDARKAKALNDKSATPALIDEKTGAKLMVPMLEKIGQLRQSSTPEAGKVYWMVFRNAGMGIKRGDLVDIEIGKFRAQGIVVE